MNDEARKLLDKARDVLEAVDVLIEHGKYDVAAGRAYYVMFHAARALLDSQSIHVRSHGGVHAAVGEHFAKTQRIDPKYHRWLIDAFFDRQESDYQFELATTAEEVATLRARAGEFLSTVREHLDRHP